MKTIWKYSASVNGLTTLEIPRGAKILHFADQQTDDNACEFWAWIDPNSPVETRVFLIIGTGTPIADDRFRYVATTLSGDVVWHLLEMIP